MKRKGVKNSLQYHGWTADQFKALTTEHLITILAASRMIITCGCHYHCGDDYLDPSDRAFNNGQRALRETVKIALVGREHRPRSCAPACREKKQLRY
jgi:hypothetical protein